MADPLLGVILDNLNSLILKEFGLIWGLDKEMKKLSHTLLTIRDVLEDAEVKQLKDKPIRHWLKKLKDAAYDADDILDEHAIEALQPEATSTNESCTKLVSNSFLSCFNFERILYRYKMGQRINEIRERLDEIATERLKFHLRQGFVDRGIGITERESSSLITELEVYGRDGDKENIVQQLLKNVSNPEVLSTYPILGMGGLGKTTLAQLAYNDERMVSHFDVRIWVCVSEPFDVKRILKSTIEYVSRKTCDLVDLGPLQQILGDILSGKRFLLVLDDVWNEDHNKWDTLKYSLACGAKGSSIVVTTRMERIALIMGTISAYHLSPLSEEDCWSLFKQRAFSMGSLKNPKLVEIGKEIVKKCGGIPLAAKALGSLMSTKSEEIEWLQVRESEIWGLPEDEENTILPALRLSYNHLSPHSRQCFSYCSVFPKDYSMKKEELIYLWIANGFIQPEGTMELEDVGNKIFNDLLWRSFFQEIEKDEDDNIERCKMHDLVHDLACSLMEEKCSIIEVRKVKDIHTRIRHLSLISNLETWSTPLESLLISQPIRTLLLKYPSLEIIKALHSSSSNLRYLRVLDLSHSVINNLPISIGKLKHLRHINLSHTEITVLPESFTSLRYLQTLKLGGCGQLQKLPKDMKNMSSLRHLDIHGCDNLTYMPIGMGQLNNLRTLSNFIVGQKSGCHIFNLQDLNQLRGELEIKGLEHVKNSVEAKEAKLMRKQNLSSLGLYWEFDGENNEEVLEGLQPHQSIRKLTISGYGGLTYPSWMGAPSLSNLVKIQFINWKKCEHLPPLGKLPHLKDLYVSEWNCVTHIGNEFYGEGVVKGFPSLEKLSIQGMENLVEWSNEEVGEVFHCLRGLLIGRCPKLIIFPLIPALEHLEVWFGNKVLLRSLKNLTSLSSLDAGGFSELIYFPEGVLGTLTALQSLILRFLPKLKTLPRELENLTALTSLEIIHCKELVSWSQGFPNLTSLKSLKISSCHALVSLAEEVFQGLSSLLNLNIGNCVSLTSLSGLRYLKDLEKLTIVDCEELESLLADDLKHLISLRDLYICGLPKLKSFPEEGIQYLTSLQRLTILHCEKLTLLPEGLQLLTALQTLEIRVCPHLKRRCEREKGEDWHKIAHIKHVIIG